MCKPAVAPGAKGRWNLRPGIAPRAAKIDAQRGGCSRVNPSAAAAALP
jgi:hypothetical protein